MQGVTYRTCDNISMAALGMLIETLHVDLLALQVMHLDEGKPVFVSNGGAAQIYYGRCGDISLAPVGEPQVDLGPNVLVIIPPVAQATVNEPPDRLQSGAVLSFSRREGMASATVISGSLRVSCGHAIDLFRTIAEPVIEQFDPEDKLDLMLSSAAAELSADGIGSSTAASSLVQHVMVKVLRKSLASTCAWARRLALLADPHIAGALSDMVARPGSPHSVLSLARRAAMSRTAFMVRFSKVLGMSPMVLLREIRMRRAARYLALDSRSIDDIARSVGYTSRSSFVRAFRSIHGMAPSEYRAGANPTYARVARGNADQRLVA
jgi:AraC family transcriptional activator of mtrCDE